ncbi:MAG: transposase family protein [Gammaproteobacteria bacterium]|nr:transposase family protein [Gammaproteobacteria bacterium]
MEFYIHKVKVYLVILLDDYSRFILNFHLSIRYTMEGIQGMVEESIQRYGKMEKILSDRGFVFHGWKGINRFERYLEGQEIYHIHTSAHHPETIGKVERVNRSIQKELIRIKEFKDILEATREIESWIWNYNYKRVHQGLGGVMVPADRFHGWSREIDKGLSKMAEDGILVEGREVNLFQIKMVDRHLEFMVMGKKLLMEVSC